jgi:hypothetical protein
MNDFAIEQARNDRKRIWTTSRRKRDFGHLKPRQRWRSLDPQAVVPTSYYNTIVSNMSSKHKMMEKEEAPLQKGNKELENLEEEVARLREENFRLRDCL